MNFNENDIRINNHYNCYQCAIEEAAKIHGVEYRMLGIGTCNFNYVRDNDLIGKRIRPHFFRDSKAWRKYSRISTEAIDCSNLDKEKLRYLLNEYGVLMAYGDVYDCPWTKVYQQNRNFHVFLIVGYKETTNTFQVIDTYMGSGILECSIDNIAGKISGLRLFDIHPEPMYSKEEFIGEIKKDALFYFENESDKCMSDFISDMNNTFDFDKEIISFAGNPYTTALTSNLDMLLRNRKGYQILLSYCEEIFKQEQWTACGEMIKNVINSISKIKMELLKAGTRKRYTDANKRVLSDELLAWRDTEIKLMKSLLKV